MKSVHQSGIDFSCEVCNKKLVSNSYLKKHIRQFLMKVKSKIMKNETSTKDQPIQQDSDAFSYLKIS